jgi:polar amino acid transport system ATP-binding protein
VQPDEMLDEAATPTGAATDVLKMLDVTMAFGDRTVVDSLSLEVKSAEKVAIIGPSGSGKTTILRLAIGLEKPRAGTIQIDGKYLWHVERGGRLVQAGERQARRARRPVGMVFQQFNLFPHMTALQNVTEPLVHVLRLRKDEAHHRATDLLSRVGLSTHLGHRPAQMSGGQQQRVAIARSLALRPKLMLFDEVTSALDPELVGEVLQVIRDLAHTTSMAMMLVTHEISFASDIADRIIVVDHGRIVEEGPPAVVLREPRSPRTQQFLRAILER